MGNNELSNQDIRNYIMTVREHVLAEQATSEEGGGALVLTTHVDGSRVGSLARCVEVVCSYVHFQKHFVDAKSD